MKRHPALVTLSHDHQHALAVALRLRRATATSAAEATAAFLAYWEAEGRRHFHLEEEELLPAYAAYGDPRHPAISQMLVDHMTIRRDAARAAAGAPLETLRSLGERLTDHVRLEEREVFVLVEQALPERELGVLAARLRELDP